MFIRLIYQAMIKTS